MEKKYDFIVIGSGIAGVPASQVVSGFITPVRRVAGGINTVEEIKGTSRSQVGGTPGRIIRALKDSPVCDPVVLLEDIDYFNVDNDASVNMALLEVINYIEHYGLRRKLIREGRYEPPAIRHSWNADSWLSNIILIQLQRHPDHHVHPRRPFTQLQSIPESPQLPYGYAVLSLVVFFPPLWRKLIHPRLL